MQLFDIDWYFWYVDFKLLQWQVKIYYEPIVKVQFDLIFKDCLAFFKIEKWVENCLKTIETELF